MSVRPPEADDVDDDLVDPRLRTALRHAPDGSAAPPEALRRAVLQAARQALPPKPTWWQRLFGSGPTMPRAWAAAAGIGAVGLALNLAWHMTTEPVPAEYGPVAAKADAKRADARQRAPAAEALPESTDGSIPPPPAPVFLPSVEPSRQQSRREAPATPLSMPSLPAPAPAKAPAPTIAPAAVPAPAPPAAPAATMAPPPPVLSKQKTEEPTLNDVAEAREQDKAANAAQPSASERVEITGSSIHRPADTRDAAVRQAPAGAFAEGAVAPQAKSLAAAAAKPVTTWPQPLARMQQALSQASDWPIGWLQQGPAEITAPGRSWWLAMLTGTAGRWQEVREPVPTSLESNPTWHVSGDHGLRLKLTVADGQAWLQSEGAVWRAPWSTLPGPSLR